MTMCGTSGCNSCIWSVSHPNPPETFPKEFSVCDKHLQEDKRFEQIFKSLVKARFDNQNGNTVAHDGWVLTKNVDTWKSSDEQCSQCENTTKLWKHSWWKKIGRDPYGAKYTLYACQVHFDKEKHAEQNPFIPLEKSWTDEKKNK